MSSTRRFRPRVVFTPTVLLVAIIAAAAPLWLLSGSESGLLIALAGLMLVLAAAAADAIFTPGARSLMVERHAPGSLGMSEETTLEYSVQSRWPRRVQLNIHDDLPNALTAAAEVDRTVNLAAFGTGSMQRTVTASQRGEFPLGRIVATVRGPLGLVRRRVLFESDATMLVTPSLAGIRRYRLLAIQHRLRDAGVRSIRRRGEGTSFAGLREYAHGDDPRRIDWKATARRQHMITREYSIEQGQTIVIAIDAGRLMTQLSGNVSRFEFALSSALVLADVALHSRDQVGLILFDDTVRAFVPPGRGSAALEKIRDALIPALPRMVEPDYAMAFRTLEARSRKRSMIVLFSDVIDVRASQAIVAYTSRSTLRHLPLLVALRNDQLVTSAVPTAGVTSRSLYEAAAAEELVSAREEALQHMRRAGVSVIDTSPSAMTAAVINRYLQIKARSAL